jgi:hypothetical protein
MITGLSNMLLAAAAIVLGLMAHLAIWDYFGKGTNG